MSSHVGDVDNLGNTNRINNSIKYTSPNLNGFRASALYSFGGVAGSQTQNQVWSLAAVYNGGAVSIGTGYLNARNPNVSFYGNTPNKGLATANNIGSAGSAISPQASPAFAGYASANTLEIISLGAAYTLSQTTLTAVVTNTRFEGLGLNSGPNPFGYAGNAIFTSAELGVRAMISPALLTGIAFDYTRRNAVKGDDGAKYAVKSRRQLQPVETDRSLRSCCGATCQRARFTFSGRGGDHQRIRTVIHRQADRRTCWHTS